MTNEQITALLAERIMGWKVCPDRYIKVGRDWVPRWRFQPTEKLEDAFRLLQEAAPQKYSISGDKKGNVHVRVQIARTVGEASGVSKPVVITHAIARALGVEVEA